MPWIKVIRAHEATGELKDVYDHIDKQRASDPMTRQGQGSTGPPPVSPPMLHSLNPKAMLHTADLMWEIMRGESRLTVAQREMIATVTSGSVYCRY